MRRMLALGLLAACTRTPDPDASPSPSASSSARASASAHASASASAIPAASGSAGATTGPCASLPVVTVTVRGDDKEWTARTHRVEGLDVDGKGTRIFVVPSSDPNPTLATISWQMHLGRDNCPVVGSYRGLADPIPAGMKSNGFEDLETRRQADHVDKKKHNGNAFVQTHRYDGTKYVGDKEQRR